MVVSWLTHSGLGVMTCQKQSQEDSETLTPNYKLGRSEPAYSNCTSLVHCAGDAGFVTAGVGVLAFSTMVSSGRRLRARTRMRMSLDLQAEAHHLGH